MVIPEPIKRAMILGSDTVECTCWVRYYYLFLFRQNQSKRKVVMEAQRGIIKTAEGRYLKWVYIWCGENCDPDEPENRY